VHWLPTSTCASTTSVNLHINYQHQFAHWLITIVDCCCWFVHQLSTLTCVLTIKTQHRLLRLNIDACINYQLSHLHQLSTLMISALTFWKSQFVTKYIVTLIIALGFSWSIVEAMRALKFPNFYYAFKLFNVRFSILLDKDLWLFFLFEFIFQLSLFKMLKTWESKVRIHCSNIKAHSVCGFYDV